MSELFRCVLVVTTHCERAACNSDGVIRPTVTLERQSVAILGIKLYAKPVRAMICTGWLHVALADDVSITQMTLVLIS